MGKLDMERDTAAAFIGESGTILCQEAISIGIFGLQSNISNMLPRESFQVVRDVSS